jgi:cyanophycinase
MAKTRRRSSKTAALHTPPLAAVPRSPRGSLVIIGGNETKDGHRPILEELASRVGRGKLVIATMASEVPEEQWQQYRKVFKELGVKRIQQLDVRQRDELVSNPRLELVDGATVLFFAGGDQLKITSRFGGTPLCVRVRELYEQGATIAGTSSGASVMSETMMVAGEGGSSQNTGESLRMAPGLGFMPGVIIDQHFAERGRIGRLLGAVAHNPRLLGIGIDEDTAILFDGQRRIRVLGSGAVYIVDGQALRYTNAAEEGITVASAYGLIMHVLGDGESFDLRSREPKSGKPTSPPKHQARKNR